MFLKRFILAEMFFLRWCAIIIIMNDEKVIQSYSHVGDGFCPLLIRPGWQVSQLNDRADLHADTVCQIERHDLTDEVFLLVKGDAALVVGVEVADGMTVETLRMESGVTYNIPRGVWHTIVTTPGMQVMIVERDNTHVNDVVHRILMEGERAELRAKLSEERF